MATPGLSSMKSYTFLDPIKNVDTILPLSNFLFMLLTTPFSYKGNTPSANISVWIPKFLWFPSWESTALGIAPIPICRVAPSSIKEATFLPMAISCSVNVAGWASISGVSSSQKISMSDNLIMASPHALGTFGLITAITVLAFCTAANVASTEVPIDT